MIFNNFHLMLDEEQYDLLKTHVSEIDIKFWLDKFCDTTLKIKIPIPTNQENLLYLSTNQIEYNIIP